MKVFVIGTGTMGMGIAQVFSQSGNDVIIFDIKGELIENGLAKLNKSLEKIIAKGKMSIKDKEEILARISVAESYKDASECDLVIEAISENIQAKKDLFKILDSICNNSAILASNTSSLSITEISCNLKAADRIIGMHFFNPAPVMKLVELVKGVSTSDITLKRAKEIVNMTGKEYVEVNESPGFIVNRILIPMINEAVCVLSENVASKEDIDKAMVLGANHPIGPLALADLIGLDVCVSILNVLYEETKEIKYKADPLLKKLVSLGNLGRKTGQGFYKYD